MEKGVLKKQSIVRFEGKDSEEPVKIKSTMKDYGLLLFSGLL